MAGITDPTLGDLQNYVQAMVTERGFDKETVAEVFTLLVEEVGELAKALRKANGQKVDPGSVAYDVPAEAADVLFMLLDLCNRLEVNLEQAFRDKELENQKREWQ